MYANSRSLQPGTRTNHPASHFFWETYLHPGYMARNTSRRKWHAIICSHNVQQTQTFIIWQSFFLYRHCNCICGIFSKKFNKILQWDSYVIILTALNVVTEPVLRSRTRTRITQFKLFQSFSSIKHSHTYVDWNKYTQTKQEI